MSTRMPIGRTLCHLALSFLILTIPALAQIRSGTITGSVKDPSGAIVTDADVTVTNTGTAVSYTTKSNGDGLFTVPYLENGTYSVTVAKNGFQTYTENDVQVDPAQTVSVAATLSIGAASAKVEVHASALQLQTESSTVSGVTTALVIDSIPNITENPFYYSGLQNGVVPRLETSQSTTPNSFGIGVAGRAQQSAYGINGGRAFENDMELDGLPIMGDGFNEATILPNLESIQEVQVISNNFSAQYGHGQGVLAITTKSGTNTFHGQASYLNRNEALMANTYMNNQQGIRRPAFKVNDVGGAISGPVLKDRLFFASSFHWLSHNYGTTSLATVPTALERTGDFGQSFIQGSNGAPAPDQIFNPFSVTEINSNLYQRAEFPKSPNGPGDYIPNPNAAGLAMLKLYPMPNHTPIDVYNDNNFQTYLINTIRRETNNNRIDYKRGRHSFYGSGGLDFGTILNPQTYGTFATPGFNNDPTTTQDRNYYAQVGDTIVLSPTLLVDLRYGITRTQAIDFAGNHSGFTQYGSFGIAPATQALFAVQGAAPVVSPRGGSNPSNLGNWTGLSGGQFTNKQERQISHAVIGSVTKIHGKWTFKAGSEFRVALANYTDFEEASTNLGGCCANDQGGNYTFEYVNATGGTTAQDNTNQISGIPGALTLVGEGVWFVRPGANLKPAYAAKYFAVYSQNDWKVRPGLTVNLGLRWDLQPGLTERYNRMAGYDFTRVNAFGYLGSVDFPGTQGYSRNLWNTEYHDFQPRVGAAWSLTPTLVAHGGFAISYLPSNTGYFSSPNDYGEATWAPGNTGALTFGANPAGVPTETITDAAPLIAATGSNASAPQTYGVGEAYFNRHLKNQIAKQGNFFLEKSFGSKAQWVLSTGWSGSYSNHLTTRNLNFENIQNVPASTLASWEATYVASNGTVNPQTVSVPNPYQPATGALLPFQGSLANRTIQQYLTLLPYPLLYGGGLNGSTGFANYNSFQARLAHSSSQWHFELNFTWSKELDFVTTGIEDGQGVNAGSSISVPDLINNNLNRNLGTDDMPFRAVGIVVYNSPFSAGGPLAPDNRIARAVLGGWSISPVVILNTGFPIFLTGANTDAITGRVERVPNVPVVLPKSYQHWYNGGTKVTLPCGITVQPANYTRLKYNACAFQGLTVTSPNGTILPAQYWYGNTSNTNGDIRGPGRANVDATLRRSFPINERFRLEISAATTNLFNHTEWNTIESGSLGSTQTVNNPANGQIPGYGTGNYGTIGNGTFDPRQVELQGRIVF